MCASWGGLFRNFYLIVIFHQFSAKQYTYLFKTSMSSDNIDKLYQNYGILAEAKDDISKVTYKQFLIILFSELIY